MKQTLKLSELLSIIEEQTREFLKKNPAIVKMLKEAYGVNPTEKKVVADAKKLGSNEGIGNADKNADWVFGGASKKKKIEGVEGKKSTKEGTVGAKTAGAANKYSFSTLKKKADKK